MASTNTKCPVCGKAVGIGLVSGLLIQHEDRNGERCEGSGGSAVTAASRVSTAGSRASTPRTPRTPKSSSTGAGSSNPRRGGVSVRRVEVDPERLKRLEEKQQQLREDRAASARARNEFYSSGLDISEDDSDAGHSSNRDSES